MPRQLRKRKISSSDSEAEDSNTTVAEVLEVAKTRKLMRSRVSGLTEEQLAKGTFNSNFSSETVVSTKIGSAFSTESKKIDEDTQMLLYIEEEIRKKKNGVLSRDNYKKMCKNRDVDEYLYEVPENLRHIKSKLKHEDLISAGQMLQGIPEVDLGIEPKIKNIMATEEAKNKVSKDDAKKSTSDIPLEFVQHKRWDDAVSFTSITPHADC